MRVEFTKKWRLPDQMWKRMKKLIPHWRPSPKGGRPAMNTGRLHAKSFTEHDFGEVRVAPAGDETLVCDSDLLGGFVF